MSKLKVNDVVTLRGIKQFKEELPGNEWQQEEPKYISPIYFNNACGGHVYIVRAINNPYIMCETVHHKMIIFDARLHQFQKVSDEYCQAYCKLFQESYSQDLIFQAK